MKSSAMLPAIYFATFTLFGLAYTPAFPSDTAKPIPSRLIGTWDVVQVAIHDTDQRGSYYYPSDPRLLGRELNIGAHEFRFGIHGISVCTPRRLNIKRTSWGALIADSFRRTSKFGETQTQPGPENFGLHIPSSTTVTAYEITCSIATENSKREFEWHEGFWFAFLNDEVVMRVGETALVRLARRTPFTKPNPSFSCGSAKSKTEKAICHSVKLSALDRSLAIAWKHAIDKNDSSDLRREQAQWLGVRDECGASAACLEEKMLLRIYDLFP